MKDQSMDSEVEFSSKTEIITTDYKINEDHWQDIPIIDDIPENIDFYQYIDVNSINYSPHISISNEINCID